MSISTHSKWNELPAKGYHQNFSARVEKHLYYRLILHNLWSSPAVPNGRSHCTEHTAKNKIKQDMQMDCSIKYPMENKEVGKIIYNRFLVKQAVIMQTGKVSKSKKITHAAAKEVED